MDVPGWVKAVVVAFAFAAFGLLAVSYHPPSPRPPNQKDQGSGHSEGRPGVLDVFTPAGLGRIAQYCAAKADSPPEKWLRERFVCDVKATDVLVALVAVFSFFVSIGVVFVAKRQVNWMHQEFHASHRPKLVVRRTTFLDEEPNQPARIGYVITNVGDTDAEIEMSDVSAVIDSLNNPFPPIPKYNNPPNNVVGRQKIKVGERVRLSAHVVGTSDRAQIIKTQTSYRVMLAGYLLYKNPGGMRRYTAFCRIWDRQIGAFVKPDEKDRIPEYDRHDYTN